MHWNFLMLLRNVGLVLIPVLTSSNPGIQLMIFAVYTAFWALIVAAYRPFTMYFLNLLEIAVFSTLSLVAAMSIFHIGSEDTEQTRSVVIGGSMTLVCCCVTLILVVIAVFVARESNGQLVVTDQLSEQKKHTLQFLNLCSNDAENMNLSYYQRMRRRSRNAERKVGGRNSTDTGDINSPTTTAIPNNNMNKADGNDGTQSLSSVAPQHDLSLAVLASLGLGSIAGGRHSTAGVNRNSAASTALGLTSEERENLKTLVTNLSSAFNRGRSCGSITQRPASSDPEGDDPPTERWAESRNPEK